MFGTMMPYEREESIPSTDTRLDRTVAIKVLPEHVANDPDLKQRFEREARTVAALTTMPAPCPIGTLARLISIVTVCVTASCVFDWAILVSQYVFGWPRW